MGFWSSKKAFSFSEREVDEEQSNGLSPYVQPLVTKLLTISENVGCKVKVDAYEAASLFIDNSALDQIPFILQVLTEAITRLENSFITALDANDRATSQSLICGVISNCFKKLPVAAFTDVVDKAVENLLKVLSVQGPSAEEDAFMALGYIADKLGVIFDRYAAHVTPFLIQSLKKPEELSVFTITITCLSSVYKSCSDSLLPITDEIMTELLDVLKSPTVDRSLKPNVIGVLCDISMNIGGEFERYLGSVMVVLQEAQMCGQTANDDETVEYMEQLRISIFEAYTGITHGLWEGGKISLLQPYIDGIFIFISNIVQIEDVSDELLSAAVGLTGDLARIIGAPLLHHVTQSVIFAAVGEANRRGGEDNEFGLRETANYTLGHIEQIRKASSVM